MEYRLRDDVKHYEEDTDHKILYELVKEEAEYIKANIPKELISKLEGKLHAIDGQSVSQCIYGMMYGDCNDKEVIQVISKLPSVIDKIIYAHGKAIFSNFRNFATPIEQYIDPIGDEFEITDGNQEELFPEETESYRKRVKQVLDLILN